MMKSPFSQFEMDQIIWTCREYGVAFSRLRLAGVVKSLQTDHPGEPCLVLLRDAIEDLLSRPDDQGELYAEHGG